jgi:hypothetical protein
MIGTKRATTVLMMAAAGLAACDGSTIRRNRATWGVRAVRRIGAAGHGTGRERARLASGQQAVTTETGLQSGMVTSLGYAAGVRIDRIDRTNFYADAKDGWYGGTGGTLHADAKGGVTIGAVEVVLRAGVSKTEALGEVDLPFYARRELPVLTVRRAAES